MKKANRGTDLRVLLTQLRNGAKDISNRRFAAYIKEAADIIEEQDKQLRTLRREHNKWRAHAARTMKQAEKLRKQSAPSGQSIRAVSGGLPSLGKRR